MRIRGVDTVQIRLGAEGLHKGSRLNIADDTGRVCGEPSVSVLSDFAALSLQDQLRCGPEEISCHDLQRPGAELPAVW